ncbi:unnamed protein product [Periconia digitata]|uniref:HTH APSES-type domain-containing protein n=1 Tax=Periconia digitata TaxID=1303443 RepID=A0A9W4XMH2_9PLEO|nr:unnamed protein product [Periconia digitata]
MNIHSLLNPLLGDKRARSNTSSSPPPVPISRHPALASNEPTPKRLGAAKDAPLYTNARPVGFVNYPPFDYDIHDNKELAAHHRSFSLFPMGDVTGKGVRRIPYASHKKDFTDKTGRDAFEVYHYHYHNDRREKEWAVVWDYNVGLVRITPFFKSLGHPKTAPAKALKESPGLMDISYSITGGSLICQGYWVPYQAAKALASTFCYDIRWALTPIFGPDFPSTCVHPKDASFQKYRLDPSIVRFCTQETNRFRHERDAYKILPSIGLPPLPKAALPPTYSPTSYGKDIDESSAIQVEGYEEDSGEIEEEEEGTPPPTRPKFEDPNWNPYSVSYPSPSSMSYTHHHLRHHHHHTEKPTPSVLSHQQSNIRLRHNLENPHSTRKRASKNAPTSSPANPPPPPSSYYRSPQISPRSTPTTTTSSWTPINGSQSPITPYAPIRERSLHTPSSEASFTGSPGENGRGVAVDVPSSGSGGGKRRVEWESGDGMKEGQGEEGFSRKEMDAVEAMLMLRNADQSLSRKRRVV